MPLSGRHDYVGSFEDGGTGVSGEVAGGQFGVFEVILDLLVLLVDGLHCLVDVAGFLFWGRPRCGR